jgi:hypothetical protein
VVPILSGCSVWLFEWRQQRPTPLKGRLRVRGSLYLFARRGRTLRAPPRIILRIPSKNYRSAMNCSPYWRSPRCTRMCAGGRSWKLAGAGLFPDRSLKRGEQFTLDEVLQLVASRAAAITGADGLAIALTANASGRGFCSPSRLWFIRRNRGVARKLLPFKLELRDSFYNDAIAVLNFRNSAQSITVKRNGCKPIRAAKQGLSSSAMASTGPMCVPNISSTIAPGLSGLSTRSNPPVTEMV